MYLCVSGQHLLRNPPSRQSLESFDTLMESSTPEAMIGEDDDDNQQQQQQCHHRYHPPGFAPGLPATDPGPSAVNCSKFGHEIKIDKETLSVRYMGKGQHQNDVGAVQVSDRLVAAVENRESVLVTIVID